MISTNDLRQGMFIVFEGRVCRVTHYEFYKPGKGSSIVRVKLKDLNTDQTLEKTWKGETRVEQAIVSRRSHEYLYRDGEMFYFMDTQNYDQIALALDKVEDILPFLKNNMEVNLVLHGETVLGVELPDFVELKVTEAEPGLKGDTASGGSKTVNLETGATINVPLFVNVGDVLKVDTRTGEYVTRI